MYCNPFAYETDFLKRSIAFIFSLSEPNNYAPGFCIDLYYQRDLIFFLFLIRLIDADSINPDNS
jgi:hypothetical protein